MTKTTRRFKTIFQSFTHSGGSKPAITAGKVWQHDVALVALQVSRGEDIAQHLCVLMTAAAAVADWVTEYVAEWHEWC